MNVTKIHRYLWLGRNDLNWYAECTAVFIKLFGEEKLDLVCKLFAATSINTSLKSNITLFRKAYYEIENNLPVGAYLPNIQNQLQRIRNGQDLSGRKISAFARAMAGDPDAVVVDIWLLRAFDCDNQYFRTASQSFREAGASEKHYTLIEGWIRHHYKREKTVEDFRIALKTLHERLANLYTHKVALDYGIIRIKPFDGIFYFELLNKK